MIGGSGSVLIREVSEGELGACAEVVNRGFGTVAQEFGLTRENCPTNAAFTEVARLFRDRTRGHRQFAAFFQRPEDRPKGPPGSGRELTMVGFFSLWRRDEHAYELEKLAVVPEHRHAGIGRALLDFAAQTVRASDGEKITIGIIENNGRLKDWYAAYGFVHTGTRTFAHLPFTVGRMELALSGEPR